MKITTPPKRTIGSLVAAIAASVLLLACEPMDLTRAVPGSQPTEKISEVGKTPPNEACFYASAFYSEKMVCKKIGESILDGSKPGAPYAYSSLIVGKGTQVRYCLGANLTGLCRVAQAPEPELEPFMINDAIVSFEVLAREAPIIEPTDRACLRGGYDYTGWEYCLYKGDVVESRLSVAGSSLKIEGSISGVEICQGAKFSAKCETFTKSTPRFSTDIAGTIRSLRVF